MSCEVTCVAPIEALPTSPFKMANNRKSGCADPVPVTGFKNGFVQFPLPALAYGHCENQRLNAILAYSVRHAAEKSRDKREAAEDLWWEHLVAENGDENGALVDHGLSITKVGSWCDADELLALAGSLQTFVDTFTEKHGPQPFVRINTDFATQVLRGQLSWNHFAVLCAINSSIGDKEFTAISRAVIQQRMLGYKTRAVLDAELTRRTDGVAPLSLKQIRCALDRLDGHYFKRLSEGRQMFFTWRLSVEAFTAVVADYIAEQEWKRHLKKKQLQTLFHEKLRAARQANHTRVEHDPHATGTFMALKRRSTGGPTTVNPRANEGPSRGRLNTDKNTRT